MNRNDILERAAQIIEAQPFPYRNSYCDGFGNPTCFCGTGAILKAMDEADLIDHDWLSIDIREEIQSYITEEQFDQIVELNDNYDSTSQQIATLIRSFKL